MFQYQKFNQYFASTTGGIESFCLDELTELGAEKCRKVYRGVSFYADIKTIYKIIYMSRLTTRVLAPLLTFDCHSDKYLKKITATVEWDKILTLDTTFAVNASVSNSTITHSLYAALCVKDGIADYFMTKYGKRPNVDTNNPDVRVNLHLHGNKAVVSLDLSGESLHKRGYRLAGGQAPMQETLAAALIRISGWNGETKFWDGMCGSGTILCEALMHYCKIPAQYLRKTFGFFNLPEFDFNKWKIIRKELDSSMRSLPKDLIQGSDKSEKALSLAKENLDRLPFTENIKLTCTNFQSISSFQNGIIVTNPPYGIRIGKRDDILNLYKEFGDFLKKRCEGTSAYIYIGDKSMRKSIGLKPSRKIPLTNGNLEGELLQIDSYRVKFRK